jgi:hypothetical protein
MANKDIIQELNNLGSSLADAEPQNIYSIPDGYFDGFADQVLNLIKVNESLTWLSSLPKNTPYQVRNEYFIGLEERVIQAIRNHPDYQTSKEEMESLSPLLSSLNKRPVYSVPEGYFENFKIEDEEKEVKTKVVSVSRKLYRYAAAAIIVGVVALGAILILNNRGNKINPNSNPQAWVAKNLKKVSSEEINEFVKLADEESTLKGSIAINTKTDDIKELMKDVPVTQISEFLDETVVEDESENSVLSD